MDLATTHHGHSPLLEVLRPTIESLSRAHQHRDPFTYTHQRRVAEVAAAIGAIMGLGADRLLALHFAGLIHDIGKLGVPSEIISKPGKLSDPEYALVKTHCSIGHDILLRARAQVPLAEMILQHHERIDGSGYPQGLKGSAIMVEARILAVADTFDAMASYRPYRAAVTEDFVLAELHRLAGQTLDRDAVEACTRYVLGGRALHPAAESIVTDATAMQG